MPRCPPLYKHSHTSTFHNVTVYVWRLYDIDSADDAGATTAAVRRGPAITATNGMTVSATFFTRDCTATARISHGRRVGPVYAVL